MNPTDGQRSFLKAVDDHPFDRLHKDHAAEVKVECQANGWAVEQFAGWTLTIDGQKAVSR